MKNNVTRIDFFKAAIGMLIVLAFAGSLLLQSAGLTAYTEVKAGEEAASIADGKNLDDKNIIPEEWFDNALFFGDSLTSSLGGYTMYFGGLGEAQFVHKNGMACHHLTRDNEKVFYAGKLCSLAEIAELSGAGKLFIQLAMNDLGRPLDELEESWKTVIHSIQDRCPDIEIYIQSGTPVHEDIGRFSKQNMLDYNEMLKNVCEELGLVYVDIARGMADENGYMPVKLMNNNEHFNNNGCVIWIDNLRDSQSYSVRPDF